MELPSQYKLKETPNKNNMTTAGKYLLIVTSLILIFRCNSDSDKKDIYLLLKTTNNSFFTDILDGAKSKVGDKYNLITKSGKREDDVESQMQALQLIVDESNSDPDDIAGVILTPTSSKGELVSLIKQLYDNKIPVIIVDTKIELQYLQQVGIDSLPFIASSNIEGGRQACTFILDSPLITNGSELLVLNGVDGQETATARNLGFHQIADTSIKKPVITERTANWNRDEAMSVTSALLSSGRKFEAIFAANDEMALGALQAVINGNISPRPIIVGFDAIDEAKRSVTEGGLTATIAQSPKQMGEQSIETLVAIIDNKSFRYTYLIPTVVISQ
jgi:ABC-type sugar transport system substrate-binding protein